MATIPLGSKARDTVTGFVGICIVRSEYIGGYVSVVLQPEVENGQLREPEHFAETMCCPYEAGPRPHQPQP